MVCAIGHDQYNERDHISVEEQCNFPRLLGVDRTLAIARQQLRKSVPKHVRMQMLRQ